MISTTTVRLIRESGDRRYIVFRYEGKIIHNLNFPKSQLPDCSGVSSVAGDLTLR